MAGQPDICDECGVETTPANRVTVHIGSALHAGAVLDLCKQCGSGVIDDPVVARAKQAFIEKWELPDDDGVVVEGSLQR